MTNNFIKVALLIVSLLYSLPTYSNEVINSSAHHLSDGTYANTSGIAYESSFNKLLKWSWERRSKNLETFEFEVEVPNYKKFMKMRMLLLPGLDMKLFCIKIKI